MPLLLGISLSNIPEGMAAGSGLRSRGWPATKVIAMWLVVVVISAASAALGHEILANDDGTWAGLAQTFAAGALLAMLADTMLPESYALERTWTGALVVGGFAGSLLIAGLVA
jgi:ZIP family zinc transporter